MAIRVQHSLRSDIAGVELASAERKVAESRQHYALARQLAETSYKVAQLRHDLVMAQLQELNATLNRLHESKASPSVRKPLDVKASES